MSGPVTVLPSSSTGVVVRAARPGDATAISHCYLDAYAVPGNGDPVKAYPFTQFMNPAWVQDAVVCDSVCWIVAEAGDEVVGSVGAVRNIGGPDDRIAELFGLVVRKKWRGKGIANDLFKAVVDALGDARFMISETRTATEQGWRVVKRRGFFPCGFEPFAHTTPAGFEPMLLLGRLDRSPASHRDMSGYSSVLVRQLAERVLGARHLEALPTVKEHSYKLDIEPWARLRRHLTPIFSSPASLEISEPDPNSRFSIEVNPGEAQRPQDEWQLDNPHASGIVSLNRLVGVDPQGKRYSEECFNANAGSQIVARSRVASDHVDRRARILYLHTLFHGLQGLLLKTIVERLQSGSAGAARTLVVDVRADHPAVHRTLEKLGFFPTIYYPALIAGANGRIDVVQYTRLAGHDIAESLQWMDRVDWPEARGVAEVVTRPARCSEAPD
jgi:GNAT superfamily N-acetyltransferase